MLRYSELVDRILTKLNLTPTEAQYDGILRKIPGMVNEALGDIANHGKPFYQTYIVDHIPSSINVNPYEDGIFLVRDRIFTFPPEFISITNELAQFVTLTIKEGVAYENGDFERVDGRVFRRLNSRQILLPQTQTPCRYLFFAVSHYPTVVGDNSNQVIDIERSVIELVPNYVVSELLRNDDVTMSTVYRNLYESGIASLNDSVLAFAGNLYDGDL